MLKRHSYFILFVLKSCTFGFADYNVFYLKIRTIVLITIVDYPLDLRAGHKKRETVEYQPFPFF